MTLDVVRTSNSNNHPTNPDVHTCVSPLCIHPLCMASVLQIPAISVVTDSWSSWPGCVHRSGRTGVNPCLPPPAGGFTHRKNSNNLPVLEHRMLPARAHCTALQPATRIGQLLERLHIGHEKFKEKKKHSKKQAQYSEVDCQLFLASWKKKVCM